MKDGPSKSTRLRKRTGEQLEDVKKQKLRLVGSHLRKHINAKYLLRMACKRFQLLQIVMTARITRLYRRKLQHNVLSKDSENHKS